MNGLNILWKFVQKVGQSDNQAFFRNNVLISFRLTCITWQSSDCHFVHKCSANAYSPFLLFWHNTIGSNEFFRGILFVFSPSSIENAARDIDKIEEISRESAGA